MTERDIHGLERASRSSCRVWLAWDFLLRSSCFGAETVRYRPLNRMHQVCPGVRYVITAAGGHVRYFSRVQSATDFITRLRRAL